MSSGDLCAGILGQGQLSCCWIVTIMSVRNLLLPVALACVVCAVGCQYAATGHNIDGKRLYDQGQYTAALQSFQRATATDPKNADAYYNMAATYHKMAAESGNQQYYQQAEDLYNQSLNLDANHVDSHRALAVLLIETERPDSAFTLLKNWASWQPNNSDAHIELARLYREFGKTDVAKQYLEHAVQLDQRNDRAWRALAALREEEGDIQQALANYHRSYTLNGFQPDVAQRIASLQQSDNGQISATASDGTRWVTPNVPAKRY